MNIRPFSGAFFLGIFALNNKKWVFDSLVKDQNDTIGLLTYAIYKHRKSDSAKGMRAKKNGKKPFYTEDEIDAAMENFHTSALNSETLRDDYKKEAVRLLDIIEQRITADLDKAHKTALTQQKREIFRKIQHHSISEQSKAVRFWNWLIGEIPKALASFILTIFVLGLAAWFAPESTKKILIEGILKTYVESIGVTTTPETKKGR